MYISGIGIVFTRGRGIDCFENALQQGWADPFWTDSFPAYRVSKDILSDKTLSKKLRRADKFSKMAVLSAVDAYKDSGLTLNNDEKLGVVLATAFGPHTTTFSFIDDILDYGDANVSPTKFSNSVHNAAVSYISTVLESRGPTVTITDFSSPFQNALLLADAWLKEDRCEHVLCGCVDELSAVMEYACKIKLKTAADGKIKPFMFSDSPVSVLGEGSVFLMLSKEKCENNYGNVSQISFSKALKNNPDIIIIDADGMAGDESGYEEISNNGLPISGYSPVFGSMIIGSAFNFAAACLMLRNQLFYKCPVLDNNTNINLCSTIQDEKINEINCIKICRSDKYSIINIKK
ncbi:MAG: beta-ketoacyl synthase chain length factor [Pseudomonadota bacterium]